MRRRIDELLPADSEAARSISSGKDVKFLVLPDGPAFVLVVETNGVVEVSKKSVDLSECVFVV